MKKVILSLVLLSSSLLGIAQEKSAKKGVIEFRAGVGFLTAPNIIEGLSSGVAESVINPGFTSVDLSGSGALMVSVLFAPDNRISFGLDFIVDKTKASYAYSNNSVVRTETNYASIMPRLDFKYINKPNFKVYGSGAIGVSMRKAENKTNNTTPNKATGGAFHITPVGIRAGNNIAFWAEAGFGFRGIVSGGLSIKL